MAHSQYCPSRPDYCITGALPMSSLQMPKPWTLSRRCDAVCTCGIKPRLSSYSIENPVISQPHHLEIDQLPHVEAVLFWDDERSASSPCAACAAATGATGEAERSGRESKLVRWTFRAIHTDVYGLPSDRRVTHAAAPWGSWYSVRELGFGVWSHRCQTKFRARAAPLRHPSAHCIPASSHKYQAGSRP